MADGAFNRVATFFPTKRPGMLVGSVKPDQLQTLIDVIKDAMAQGQGIVFFAFLNAPGPDSKTAGSLTVAVEKPREQSGYGNARRPIGNTPAPAANAPRPDPLAALTGGAPAPAPAPRNVGW